ncbi:50S ribosomal protein L19 [Candidatus Wirthbacteria bacterium CG2_30_54_11]|uniref:Large ribosomal subunit protein bL19 n=1 Tax=Candidatus Wirthbacteria bacterium CG2_30_54_11 TaxID=1817892 RepID=A0A1J5INR7_9BACT|nr:MAG: 50S ribosomal protein L19 [Candidatus Wirthbacteria bacterium CG2_30_54_11]
MIDLKNILPEQLKNRPEFATGDTIKVHVKIVEGDKERTQMFEGVVTRCTRGRGMAGNFTVRRIASGVGVERTFFLHSPNVQAIDIIRRGKVKRARLYYLRSLKTKTIRIKERRETSTKTVKKAVVVKEPAAPVEETTA